MSNIMLIPLQEMAPGQASAIRNSVMDAVVAKASRELALPENKLVIRDIRPYSDLAFGTNTDYMATALSVDIWGAWQNSASSIDDGTAGAYRDAIVDGTTMADSRYVTLYGVRDMRLALNTQIDQDISLIKFDIGAADRTIWDLSKCEAYSNSISGMTSSPVVITPLTPYQISMYLIAGATVPYVEFIGFVVEPVGLLITP